MTKQEFATLAMAIRTYYPKEQILPNQQAMELWYRELQDIPADVAEAALRKWVATNKWSPSIAELRETAAEVRNGEIPDWGEGWEKVLTAIRRFGSYREREALDSLDPMTRTCVQRLGFRNICMSENISHDRANFRMMYESLAEREQARQQIALPLQEVISQLRLENSTENGFLKIGGS